MSLSYQKIFAFYRRTNHLQTIFSFFKIKILVTNFPAPPLSHNSKTILLVRTQLNLAYILLRNCVSRLKKWFLFLMRRTFVVVVPKFLNRIQQRKTPHDVLYEKLYSRTLKHARSSDPNSRGLSFNHFFLVENYWAE